MQIEVHSIAEDGSLSKRAVPLIENGSEPTPVGLHHVMPARDFFAPLGTYKEAISALLDSLGAGETSLRTASPAPQVTVVRREACLQHTAASVLSVIVK